MESSLKDRQTFANHANRAIWQVSANVEQNARHHSKL